MRILLTTPQGPLAAVYAQLLRRAMKQFPRQIGGVWKSAILVCTRCLCKLFPSQCPQVSVAAARNQASLLLSTVANVIEFNDVSTFILQNRTLLDLANVVASIAHARLATDQLFPNSWQLHFLNFCLLFTRDSPWMQELLRTFRNGKLFFLSSTLGISSPIVAATSSDEKLILAMESVALFREIAPLFQFHLSDGSADTRSSAVASHVIQRLKNIEAVRSDQISTRFLYVVGDFVLKAEIDR